MKESQGNKDSLVEAKTAFNQTREAIRLYSNQFYAVVDHVRPTDQRALKKKCHVLTQRAS